MKRRLPAEWEPQLAVQLTLPHRDSDWGDQYEQALDCFIEIIKNIARFQNVLIVCQNVAEIKNHLTSCSPNRLVFAEVESDDSWARDHAVITVLENEVPLYLDFTFNGWGGKFDAEKDNRINRRLFQQGVYKTDNFQTIDFVLEGGSIESDGQGTILTTTQCLLNPNRNPNFTKDLVEQKLQELLGAERVLWLDRGELIGDDTDAHIDTLARFCNTDTITFVKCYDPNDAHFESLKKMEQQLQKFKTKEGNPYHLIPLPLPAACYSEDGHRLPATYANFLIINEAVLVPVYGVPQDEEALTQIQKAFPERGIIAVNCRPLIEQHGSLHCVTMQFPKLL